METRVNEPSEPFRFNRRVLQMVAVMMVALVVPLVLVVLGLRSMRVTGPAPEAEGLRASLDSAAEKHFPSPQGLGGGRRFTLSGRGDAGEAALLLEQAAAASGGLALVSAEPDGSLRIRIRIPSESSDHFVQNHLQAFSEAGPAEPAQAAAGLFEVLIPAP